MRITMVGAGYVGLVTGTCFANTGNHVTCLDVDQDRINRLNQGFSPIYEPGLDELIRRNTAAGRLVFTTDREEAYASAQAIFVCVGTPSDARGFADLTYVLAAARDIGEAIEAAPGEAGGPVDERRAKIVVVKSTVPVGTNARVKAEIAGRTGKPFHMASNPEFLKEGAAIADFMKPDRVVIGVEQHGVGERMRDLYAPFVRQGNPIFLMDIASAEMVKYSANAMLATKISFINEIANLCEAYGADIEEVRRGMCADARIGNKFLYPGLGYGGSCFPKDVLACISMGEQIGTATQLLAAVHAVNQQQRHSFLEKVIRLLAEGPTRGAAPRTSRTSRAVPVPDQPASDGDAPPRYQADAHRALAGRKIAVWGIAFKPGTDDIREAPSVTLMQGLLDAGAKVVAHDPVAHESCRRVADLGKRIAYADTPEQALEDADALVICTDWDEFKHPDFAQMKRMMKSPIIFDGRNLYDPEQMRETGFVYHSIGRDPVVPEPAADGTAARL